MLNYEEIAAGVEIPTSEAKIEVGGQPTTDSRVRDYIEMAAKGPNPAPTVESDVPFPAPPPARKEYRVSDPRYQGLAEEKGYDQSYARIAKLRYSHEAMIDIMIAEPSIKQGELAIKFGHTQAWISRIIGSDAFQAALAKRREELTDPFLIATIEERFNGLAMQSIDILTEKLELTKNADIALKALDISSKALGFGARNSGGGQVQNNFVVQLPAKMMDSGSWANKHTATKMIEG